MGLKVKRVTQKLITQIHWWGGPVTWFNSADAITLFDDWFKDKQTSFFAKPVSLAEWLRVKGLGFRV